MVGKSGKILKSKNDVKIHIGYVLKSAEVRTLVSRRYSENSSHIPMQTIAHTHRNPCILMHTCTHPSTDARTSIHPCTPAQTLTQLSIPTPTHTYSYIEFECVWTSLNWSFIPNRQGPRYYFELYWGAKNSSFSWKQPILLFLKSLFQFHGCI